MIDLLSFDNEAAQCFVALRDSYEAFSGVVGLKRALMHKPDTLTIEQWEQKKTLMTYAAKTTEADAIAAMDKFCAAWISYRGKK